MGNDISIYANHSIDFNNNDIEILANKIKESLDTFNIINLDKIKNQIRGYYDWQGYNDEHKNRWHKKIDDWKGNEWEFSIDNDLKNYVTINYFGPYSLNISFTNKRIQFNDPGCRYDSFFGMDKNDRIEWRLYYYQIIRLFGGNYALYLPDQGNVAWEFTENISGYNIDLNIIIKGLIEKYGNNIIKIDDFSFDENNFIDTPYYFVDDFEDIKNIFIKYKSRSNGI